MVVNLLARASLTISVTDAGTDPIWDITPSDLTFTQDESSSVTFSATADPYFMNTINYSASGTADNDGWSKY